MEKEEVYIVWDFDKGLVSVGEKETAEKDYAALVDENERFYDGEQLSDDEMGYKAIIAKLYKGQLIQMNEVEGQWEWLKEDTAHGKD